MYIFLDIEVFSDYCFYLDINYCVCYKFFMIMEKFIQKIWVKIKTEQPQFSEKDIACFYHDFSEMTDNMWYKYHSFSFSALKQLVEENQRLFEYLADIMLYEPRFCSAHFIQEWLFFVFETGKLPRAGDFVSHLSWSVEKVAPLVPLYIKDEQMRGWIVKNWNVCQKYRFNILWALREEHIFDANLFEVYNPHFLRQFTAFVMIVCGMTYVYVNDFIPHVLFWLILPFLIYWILTELSVAILCSTWRAFW